MRCCTVAAGRRASIGRKQKRLVKRCWSLPYWLCARRRFAVALKIDRPNSRALCRARGRSSPAVVTRRGMKELTGALTLRRAQPSARQRPRSRCHAIVRFYSTRCNGWKMEIGPSIPRVFTDIVAIRPFPEDILARRTKRTMKKAKKIRQLDTQQRHKLRIAAKKLRYASEFRPPVCRPSGEEASDWF